MRVYFDTSAINQIMLDNEMEMVLTKILDDHEPFISVMNIAEICANSNQEERKNLLHIARRMTRGYYPLARPQDILYRSLRAYLTKSEETGLSLSVQDRPFWDVLNHPDLADESVRAQCSEWAQRQKEWYINMNRHGRPHIQQVLQQLPSKDKNKLMRSASSFLRHFMDQGEFLKDVVTGILSDEYLHELKGRELDALLKIEAWRLYISAIGVGIYRQSVLESNYSFRKNAGAVDLEQAIYLIAADLFITHDKPQRNAMRIVERFGHSPRRILSYRRFKEILLK